MRAITLYFVKSFFLNYNDYGTMRASHRAVIMIIEEEALDKVQVISVVPQGSVLGPILFPICIRALVSK